MKPLWVLLVVGLVGCSGPAPSGVPTTSTERASTADQSDVKTMLVGLVPVEATLRLTGQVNPTEKGRADVTTPLQGIVIEPLVRVGQHVGAGLPLAEINNVYGQTSLQLKQKLETDQAAVLTAQSALQAAVSTLGQARSTLAQAETAASQAEDNRLQAQAELANARVDSRRKQELLSAGVASQADVDDARERVSKAVAVAADSGRQVGIARHAVDIARRNIGPSQESVRLARNSVDVAGRQVENDEVAAAGASHMVGNPTTQFYIRSPIAGVVTAVNMSAGLSVSPGTILATVMDTSEVYVDANAYQSDLQGMGQGDAMQVKSDAFPDERFAGHVSYVGTQVEPSTRTVNVRCRIDNPKEQLRPGMYVDIMLAARHPRQAIVVPDQAILVADRERYVVIKDPDGKYERRSIREGVRTEKGTEVVSGLKPGEQVVTQGNLLVVPP